jgi:hypothetical protein
MSYFIFTKQDHHFMIELSENEAYLLAFFPNTDFEVIISHHGY